VLVHFVEAKPDLKWLDPPDVATALTIADVFKTKSGEKNIEHVWTNGQIDGGGAQSIIP